MSYTISPIKDSEKVTYEVQRWNTEWSTWVAAVNGVVYDANRAFSLLNKNQELYPIQKFRVIQRTESIALVLREGE